MPYAGDDVSELEARQEPRLVRALEMVAPGTAVREGLDNIVQGRTGALICIGESEELNFLLSGGVKLDVDYTPAMVYQLAKMDGAIVLASNGTNSWPNCALRTRPPVAEPATPRPGERFQATDRVFFAIFAIRSVVSLYLDGAKYCRRTFRRSGQGPQAGNARQVRSRLDQCRPLPPRFERRDPARRVLCPALGARYMMAVEIER